MRPDGTGAQEERAGASPPGPPARAAGAPRAAGPKRRHVGAAPSPSAARLTLRLRGLPAAPPQAGRLRPAHPARSSHGDLPAAKGGERVSQAEPQVPVRGLGTPRAWAPLAAENHLKAVLPRRPESSPPKTLGALACNKKERRVI